VPVSKKRKPKTTPKKKSGQKFQTVAFIPGAGELPSGPIGIGMVERVKAGKPFELFADGERAACLFDDFPSLYDGYERVSAIEKAAIMSPPFRAWAEHRAKSSSAAEQAEVVKQFVEDDRFYFAVSIGFFALVEYLLEEGIDPDECESRDHAETPMEFLCSETVRPETVERMLGLLLRHGATPTNKCVKALTDAGEDFAPALAMVEGAILAAETAKTRKPETPTQRKPGRTARGSITM
jgi:hypothetical protein